MAISAVQPGSGGAAALRAALAHPAVVRLAEALKLDLDDETVRGALIDDALRNMQAAPPTTDANADASGTADNSPTNYRVRAALRQYDEISRL